MSADAVTEVLAHFGVEDNRLPRAVIDVLAHVGVMGMHWGVRRASGGGKSGHLPPKGGKIPPRTLTDAELRTRIARIQLERQYADLTKPQKSEGQKIVHDIMVGLAKDTGKLVGTKLIYESFKKAGIDIGKAAKDNKDSKEPAQYTPSTSEPAKAAKPTTHTTPAPSASKPAPSASKPAPSRASSGPTSYRTSPKPVDLGYVPAHTYNPNHTYQEPTIVKRLLITAK